MARILVDANVIVDLFKTSAPSVLKTAKALVDLRAEVFISEQVKNEVLRNKLKVASEFIDEQQSKLQVPTAELPSLSKKLNNKLKKTSELAQGLRGHIDKDTNAYLQALSGSDDKLSRLLKPLFNGAVQQTEDQYQRAKRRRSLGNPPGKHNQQIGDQLTWEQFLDQLGPETDVWIVSRDGDYARTHRDYKILNPLLNAELREKTGTKPRVHVFESISKAVAHFIERVKPDIKTKLTAKDAAMAAQVQAILAAPSADSVAKDVVYTCMPKIVSDLVNDDDAVVAEIAMTNAVNWGLNDCDVTHARYVSGRKIKFIADVSIAGDADDEQVFAGDTITFVLRGNLVRTSEGGWGLDDYTVEYVHNTLHDDDMNEP